MIVLTFISGHLKGKTFRPSEERFGIGREPDSALCIRTPHVSSRHGRIERRGNRYVYRDLGSTNGSLIRRKREQIFLSEKTGLETVLQDGDHLVLGVLPNPVVIRITIRPDGAPPIQGTQTILATCSMKELPEIQRSVSRDHEGLLALYDYAREIQGINSSRELIECVSRSVFSLFPHASHVTMLRMSADGTEHETWAAYARTGEPGDEPPKLSQSILRRALENREAVLFQDARRELSGAESIVASGILSCVCVPLLNQRGAQALLQVDNRESDGIFQRRDLELLTIMGNQASTLLGNIQLYEQLKATLDRLEVMELVKCHMSKFVPSTVQKIIEQDPRGLQAGKEEKVLTVLFLDICGYTKMSEAMLYEEVNHIVERYFSLYMDAIHAHNGDINETAGDGLMVIFQGEEHARDAVDTAVEIDRITRVVNAERTGKHPPVFVNIGVNTGPASVGLVELEGHSGTRWTYTASGSTTNLAARMTGFAEGGQIIVGESTAERIGKEAYEREDLGEQILKNVSRPQRLYRIVP